MMEEVVQAVTVWALPLLFAITLHEAAHGFAAKALGDDTAWRLGRVSANPLRHVDTFGTIILPALLLLSGARFLFGWAKPVPVDFSRLRPLRLGMVLVALAGPGTNVTLAVISALLVHVAVMAPEWSHEWLVANLWNSIQINLVLAVFNMLPLPPLDGGRVAVGLLPRPLAMPLARLEGAGLFILLAALFLLPMIGIDFFRYVVGTPVNYLATLILRATGLA